MLGNQEAEGGLMLQLGFRVPFTAYLCPMVNFLLGMNPAGWKTGFISHSASAVRNLDIKRMSASRAIQLVCSVPTVMRPETVQIGGTCGA